MRFLELRLIAFGGFEGLTLDLSAPGLHVVLGRNEAGKSTTLRALTHVLYGVPERTPDAYRFPMANLRIGARLLGEDGTVLDVVRKKGRTKTLLDRDDRPIDDAPLRKMLHGVSEELYASSFGLTHAALQRGAQALLDGGGDLGESLFQAGLGGGALHALLGELAAEAERIYSPTARNKPLNEALRVLGEAKKSTADRSASHESYQAQVEHIAAQRARKTAAAEERSALLLEQKRLQRLKGMLPLFAKRGELAARRAQLGSVVVLPEDAPRDRADALRAHADAEAAITRLTREIDETTARRAALTAPDALADAAAELEGLPGELALHQKNAQELPRLRASLEVDEAAARDLARATFGEAARDAGDADASPLAVRVDTKAAARVRSLASEPKRIQALLRDAGRALDDATALLTAFDAAPAADSDRVRGLVQRLERRWKGLGLVSTDLSATLALAVPTAATVDKHERALGALAEEARRGAEERARVEAQGAEVARALDALRRAAAVPTEADLAAARARRDGLWAELRADLAAADAGGRAADLERAIALADDVADRLRREAARVTRLAELLADEAAMKDARARAAAARASLEAREAEALRAWNAEWAHAGIAPLTPAEMRAWLERHAKLVEAEAEAEDARADARRERAAERERLEQAVQQHARERARCEKDLAEWQAQWALAVRKLGVAGDLGVDEALQVVEDLAALGHRAQAAHAQRARVAAATAENARIEARARELTLRLAPDLAALPTTEAGQQLVRRFDLARQERARRAELDGQLEDKRESLGEQVARRDACSKRLAALMTTAGVASLEGLVAAEKRSADARALDADDARVADVLLAKADGAPLGELAAAAEATRPEAIDARLDEIEARLTQVDDDLTDASVQVDRSERGLAALDRDGAAAAAAGDAQAAVARAQALAERWARVRLAEALLAREILRYRDRNQGPVLGRASEVFRTLTRGAWEGLRAGLDDGADRPLLLASRAKSAGGDVATHLLSEGTRDQVYLALRVASLERHAAAAGPLPVVLDDILIQFDDERARAALEVLAELAGKLQVLLFTHHQRIVDLARAACPGALAVHELGGKPGAAAQLVLTT